MKPRLVTNALMVSGFALVSIIGMEFLAVNIGQPAPFQSDYTLNAIFPDADGIAVSADVAASGVAIGKVTSVRRDAAQPGMSVVTLSITDANAVPVHGDATATVRPKTLLGEKYVDLRLGSDGSDAIPSGGYLPVSQAGKDVSNDEIFNAFDAQARTNTQKVLTDLNAAIAQRSGDVRAILPNLQTAVNDLVPVAQVYERDQPEVDRILLNLDTILRITSDENQQLAGLLANGNVVIGAVAQRDGSLIKTLREAGDVAAEINAAASPTIDAQRRALDDLAPALGSVNKFLDEVVGPQTACGGRSCGIAEVFTGTLTGNLNYPNDQLTVTSPAGNTVTEEWASMFSAPAYGGNSGATHSALNLVLSFHCDAASQMLAEVVSGLSASQQAAIQDACQAATAHTGSSSPQASASGSPLPDEIALLLGGAV